VQLLDCRVSACDGRRRPCAGGEQHQRVEHVDVEPGVVRQGIVAPFDRCPKLAAQRGIAGGLMFEVCHAEGDVTCLVHPGQAGDLTGDRIGSVRVQECEQRKEIALAEDRQQERG
jgi:hypothetical protein